MDLGVFTVATDQTMPIAALAQAAEERGFASLFIGEHSHFPVETRLPDGQPLPDTYQRFLDPFVGLAFAAAATNRLRIGTGVCLVALHDPILLAKTAATLDHLSGGRFVFGVGYGYNPAEFRNHGIDPRQRRQIVREKLCAMKELWTKDTASFHGDFVSFSPSHQYPKPIQTPHPPIIFGGAGLDATFDDIVELGDGWMPTSSWRPWMPAEKRSRDDGLTAKIADLRRRLTDSGRDPSELEIIVFYTVPDRSAHLGDGAGEPLAPEIIDRYAAMGATTLALPLPSESPGVVLGVLDRYAELFNSKLVVRSLG